VALRVALTIDGDARGAEQAARDTTRALEQLGERANTANRAIQEGAERAAGAIGKIGNAAAAANGAANDNARSITDALIGSAERLAGKFTATNESLARMTGGAAGFARVLSDTARAAGPAALLVGGIQLAEAAVVGLYNAITRGAPSVTSTLEEHARLVGVVRNAYKDAADRVGEFLHQSRAQTLFEAQQNLDRLKDQLKRRAGEFAASNAPEFGGLGIPGLLQPGDIATASQLAAATGALAEFRAGAAAGEVDARKLQDAITELGAAARGSNKEFADWAERTLVAIREHFKSLPADLKTAEALVARLQGHPSPEGDKRIGLAPGTSAAAGAARQPNEFERTLRSMERQAASLEAEQAALGKTAGEAARLRAEFVLLEAAQQGGIAVNDELRGKIDTVAGRLAAAAAATERYGHATAAAGAIGSQFTDTLFDWASGARSASDSLRGLTRNLAQMLAQAALAGSGPLAGVFGTSQSGGIFGQLLRPLFAAGGAAVGLPVPPLIYGPGFAAGGYTGDGPRQAVAGVAHGQEFVVNAMGTARHRALLEAINANRFPGFERGYYAGGGPSYGTPFAPTTVHMHNDLRGATNEAAILKQLDNLQKNLPDMILAVLERTKALAPGRLRLV
jgi:hypothetical protein